VRLSRLQTLLLVIPAGLGAGCAAAEGVGVETPAARAAAPAVEPVGSRTDSADPELGELRATRTLLEERLGQVQAQLLGQAGAPPGAPRSSPSPGAAADAGALPLQERRLALLLALREIDRALGGAVGAEAPRAAGPAAAADADRREQDAGRRVAQVRQERERRLLAEDQRFALLERDEAKERKKLEYKAGKSFDFEQEAVSGELLRPDDSLLLPRAPAAAAAEPTVVEPAKPPARAAERHRSGRRPGAVGEAVVRDSAPPEGVMEAVSQQLPRLTQCVPADAWTKGDLSVRVRARIDGEGRLRDPRVDAGGSLGPDVTACLADVLGRVRAPAPPDGTSHTVAFPLWLSSPK
jgi:hypothetical protein